MVPLYTACPGNSTAIPHTRAGWRCLNGCKDDDALYFLQISRICTAAHRRRRACPSRCDTQNRLRSACRIRNQRTTAADSTDIRVAVSASASRRREPSGGAGPRTGDLTRRPGSSKLSALRGRGSSGHGRRRARYFGQRPGKPRQEPRTDGCHFRRRLRTSGVDGEHRKRRARNGTSGR